MIRIRRKSSDPERSRGESDKEMSKKKAAFNLKAIDAERGSTPKMVNNGTSNSSSSQANSMVDYDKDVLNSDPYMSLRVADTTPRRTVRNGKDISDSDPYVALRIADTPRARRSSGVIGTSDPYVSLRIADTPSRKTSAVTSRDAGPNTDAYVSLRIADSKSFDNSVYNGDEVIYDSNGSSGTEEDAYDSDSSRYLLDEGLSEFGEDTGSEDVEKDFSSYARVSGGDSETEHKKGEREFSGYVRVSVAGSDAGKDGDRESVGFARVSVAGSEIDYGRDVYARVSRAGVEVDNGVDIYARISGPGIEVRHGHDVYSRLSSAGSEVDHERGVDGDFSGYARASVSGSELGHGKDVYAKVSVAGSEAGHLKDVDGEVLVYARVSVAGSEAELGKDFDKDVYGYARLTVVGSEAEGVDATSSGVQDWKDESRQLSEKEFSVLGLHGEEDQELWNKEYETYMDLSPDRQARLQYRVRVVLISPLFELNEHKLSGFSDLYRSKFGEDVKTTGFSSAARLCRAMPHVVQKKPLEDNGELILVDSSRNRRAISGIRSGLRRIVYDALKSFAFEDITVEVLEEKCSELLGRPFMEVLTEHGYDTPSVESLVRDMPDIADFVLLGYQARVFLCPGAEDPAVTDGLLVKSTAHVNMKTSNIAESKEVIPEAENRRVAAKDFCIPESSCHIQPESLKFGSMVTLRSLKNELKRVGSFCNTSVSVGDENLLQVRFRMRILLAFHNSGRGVEVRELPELYAKTFGTSLNLQELGFGSLMELARCWQDIFLLQELKPDWVFLVPSQANRRVLNTLRTGLRSTLFSVLVETYPEGVDPLDFLHRLQQAMSGELWEVLDATGYICSEVEKTDSMLSSSSSSELQLVDFEEVCVLLDDMMDFVRLGSNEDGSVVVKLRNGEVPLVDLLDCKMEETDVGSFDELFVNLMMIAVDDTETSGDDGSPENGGYMNVGRVQSIVKSFEGSAGLRSAHSQTPNSLRLKHEIRLILGCPEYFESGLPWNELNAVYKDRTGQEIGSKSKVKSLLRAMPDIVCKDSLGGDSACLSKTPKNLRVVSTTRSGLRQVLFWALVKNPGGVWANLLEGWFTDFAGVSLTATLQIHGYEMSKSRPFFPVVIFLKDMSDILQKKSTTYEIYSWAGEMKDPVHRDAKLLGLPELMIQYDPVRRELESMPKVGDILDEIDLKKHKVEGFVDTFAFNGFNGYRDVLAERTGVEEEEDEDDVESNLEDDFALKISIDEDNGDKEAKLDHLLADETPLNKERGGEGKDCAYHQAVEVPGREEIDESTGNDEGHLISNDDEAEKEDFDKITGVLKEEMKEDHADKGAEDQSYGTEKEEIGDDDGNYLLHTEDLMGRGIEGESSESIAEAYAQLRVAGKGLKVNLDEWQFTDEDEDEDEDYDVNDSADGEEYSETENTTNEQGKILAATTYVAPKVKETGKDASRAWVLPNKGIPWK